MVFIPEKEVVKNVQAITIPKILVGVHYQRNTNIW